MNPELTSASQLDVPAAEVPALTPTGTSPAPHTILNVSQNHYVRGGSDRYFFVLSELLQQHGHRVIPFAAAQKDDLPSEWSKYFPPGFDFSRPRVRDIPRFVYSRPAAQAMRRLIADVRPDVAHLQIYYGQLTASILEPLREAGIPIVQTIHDFKLVCPVYSLMSHGEICEACQGRQFWKAAVRRCNRGSLARSLVSTVESYVSRHAGIVDKVDRFIAVSDFQRNKLAELGVPADKITVIHNFKDATTIEPSFTAGEYFLYFGRIERLKGIFTLLDAAERLPQARFILVGDGDARAEVAQRLARPELAHVELQDFASGDRLARLIQGSLATILPSEGYDNCPMAVLESLAYAKPVVGSRIGGIPELVDEGQDGWLADPGDAEDLAACLNRLWQDSESCLAMGRRGREKVLRRFNSENYYQQLLDVYGQVLSAHAAG